MLTGVSDPHPNQLRTFIQRSENQTNGVSSITPMTSLTSLDHRYKFNTSDSNVAADTGSCWISAPEVEDETQWSRVAVRRHGADASDALSSPTLNRRREGGDTKTFVVSLGLVFFSSVTPPEPLGPHHTPVDVCAALSR